MRRIAVLTVAVLALPGGAALALPVQWDVAVGGNGHWYEAFVVQENITWDDADAAATSLGGYLATITSPEENAFVYSVIDDPSYWYLWPLWDPKAAHGPWLGGVQSPGSAEPDGGWMWVTGEPYTYENWAAGQPNNNASTGLNENRIHFYAFASSLQDRQPTWNDASNIDTNVYSYVVEFIPEPATLTLFALGGWGLLRRRR